MSLKEHCTTSMSYYVNDKASSSTATGGREQNRNFLT